MKAYFKNISKKKVMKNLSMAILLTIMTGSVAYAEAPKLVTGTVELAKAVSGWITLAVGVVAGAMLGYHGLGYVTSDDEAVKSDRAKKMKAVFKGGAIAITAPGLVTLVLNFYK